ncbi:guanylate-binding protein 2-like [Ruditapes philippinarum]|uniref:guanylate-binding protein 2-like n=1 Tax=Ruditapes philippinarum TaxID=129788 RepID=UPI00295B6FC9|nr:guanylate-binding protein 2-like [Ruditapes philippinarum]
MDGIWNKVKTTNEKKVREKCENTLQNVFVKYLKNSIKNGEYETAGGHRRYKHDVERTKDEYVSVLRDFKENEILSTWYGFVESMKRTEAKILEADENLSQREKEAEQRRNQEKLDELLRQQQKAHEDALFQQKQYLEDHYEKIDKDRREKQAADQERYEVMLQERLKETEEVRLQEVERRLNF